MWVHCKEWFVRHATSKYGQVWLGLISASEAIFLPVPTDTFMVAMLLVGENIKRWFYYATLTMVTSVIGGVIGYFLAYWLFDLFGPPIIAFYNLEEEFANAQGFFSESVFLFTFIGAVSPIPYKIFVLTAGFMKVNFFVFLLASILGRSLRLYIGAWLAYMYGPQSLRLIMRYSLHITIIALGVLVTYILGYMFL